MSKLSVLILAKNEERHIEACIASAAFADEILVIDSGSTDRTVELAEKNGAKVIARPMTEEGFAGQRNFAQTVAGGDWILYLDADERIPSELQKEILAHICNLQQAAGRFRRESVVMGQRMRHGVYRPDEVVRLFPRGSVHWVGKVHERPETSLPQRTFHTALRHHCLDSWEQYFGKFDQYTTLMAERMHQNHRKTSPLTMQLHAIYAFLHMYFLKLGFLDGYLGFVLCVYHYFYTLTKYLKLNSLNEKNQDVHGESYT